MNIKTLLKHLAHITPDDEVIFVDNSGKRYKVDAMVCRGGKEATIHLLEVEEGDE